MLAGQRERPLLHVPRPPPPRVIAGEAQEPPDQPLPRLHRVRLQPPRGLLGPPAPQHRRQHRVLRSQLRHAGHQLEMRGTRQIPPPQQALQPRKPQPSDARIIHLTGASRNSPGQPGKRPAVRRHCRAALTSRPAGSRPLMQFLRFQVDLGGAEASVPESLLDDLEVGAAGEQPRGMRMPKIMDADMGSQVRRLQRSWQPHVEPEPARRDVPVGVQRPRPAAGRLCRPLAARPGTGRRRPGSRRTGTGRASTRSSCRAGSAVPAAFGSVKPERVRIDHQPQLPHLRPVGSGAWNSRSSRPRSCPTTCAFSLAAICALSLKRRNSLSLG